ncbi:MAG: hypothetical protein R6U94_09430 [Nitriliruptoraceae bacterium]
MDRRVDRCGAVRQRDPTSPTQHTGVEQLGQPGAHTTGPHLDIVDGQRLIHTVVQREAVLVGGNDQRGRLEPLPGPHPHEEPG